LSLRIYSGKDLRNYQKGSLLQAFKERMYGDQIKTLNLGFKYAIEKDPKHYINQVITDTENTIRYLNAKMQNSYRYLTNRKIKEIIDNNTNKLLTYFLHGAESFLRR